MRHQSGSPAHRGYRFKVVVKLSEVQQVHLSDCIVPAKYFQIIPLAMTQQQQ